MIHEHISQVAGRMKTGELSRAHTVRFFLFIFLKSFRIVLVRLYEHDDHVTLWDLSCH